MKKSHPYYLALAANNLLTQGEKTVKDHHGNDVLVTGQLLNGVLTGKGEYVCPRGFKWVAWFHKDVKHGWGHCIFPNGIVQFGTHYNGIYHGPMNFYYPCGWI